MGNANTQLWTVSLGGIFFTLETKCESHLLSRSIYNLQHFAILAALRSQIKQLGPDQRGLILPYLRMLRFHELNPRRIGPNSYFQEHWIDAEPKIRAILDTIYWVLISSFVWPHRENSLLHRAILDFHSTFTSINSTSIADGRFVDIDVNR